MSNRLINIDFSDSKTIASNIKKLMKIHGVNEISLASALGVSKMTIRRVISGETEDPRISTISLIAEYFNVSIDALLEDISMPINFLKKEKVNFLPIIGWEDLSNFFSEKNIDLTDWQKWYPFAQSSTKTNKKSFILESKKSIQPRYPDGSLLLINPDETPLDGDVVLIKTKDIPEISIRVLVIDSPRWILRPIIMGSETMFYNENHHEIVGVLMLTIFPSRN